MSFSWTRDDQLGVTTEMKRKVIMNQGEGMEGYLTQWDNTIHVYVPDVTTMKAVKNNGF